jgi:hypothetical protein
MARRLPFEAPAMRAPHPTLSDPVIVTTRDRSLFVCWVESRHGVERWVFIGADRTRYTGPTYGGQTTMDSIRDLVETWWDTVTRPDRRRS